MASQVPELLTISGPKTAFGTSTAAEAQTVIHSQVFFGCGSNQVSTFYMRRLVPLSYLKIHQTETVAVSRTYKNSNNWY